MKQWVERLTIIHKVVVLWGIGTVVLLCGVLLFFSTLIPSVLEISLEKKVGAVAEYVKSEIEKKQILESDLISLDSAGMFIRNCLGEDFGQRTGFNCVLVSDTGYRIIEGSDTLKPIINKLRETGREFENRFTKKKKKYFCIGVVDTVSYAIAALPFPGPDNGNVMLILGKEYGDLKVWIGQIRTLVLVFFGLLSLGLLPVILLFVNRVVIAPIRQCTLLIREMGQHKMFTKGDNATMTNQTDHVMSADETVLLHAAIGEAREAIRQVVVELLAKVNGLISLSNYLAEEVSGFDSGSQQEEDETRIALNAVNQSLVGFSLFTSDSERMLNAIKGVADTLQEMSVSINNVTQKYQQESKSVHSADLQVQSARDAMSTIHQSAQAIGKIASLIRSIAEQEQHLGLNSAIESMHNKDEFTVSIGEANEVSRLASEAGDAVQEVITQIRQLQDETENAKTGMGRIVELMHAMDAVSLMIIKAMDAQCGAIFKIFGNVKRASDLAESMRKQAGETQSLLRIVRSSVETIKASDINGMKISHIRLYANDFVKFAHELQEILGTFRVV